MNAGWYHIQVWIRIYDPVRPYWVPGEHVGVWWQNTWSWRTADELAMARGSDIFYRLEPVNDRVEIVVSRYSLGRWTVIRRFVG
jgi:hypothetical protein